MAFLVSMNRHSLEPINPCKMLLAYIEERYPEETYEVSKVALN
jgi:hypothetical protein